MSSEDRPKYPAIFDGVFYTIAGLCGFATGIVGAAFHLCVNALMAWPTWLPSWVASSGLTIIVAAIVAAVAVTLAFLLTDRIAPEASGSGVPQVEGALEGVHEIRWRRVLPVKFVGGVLGLSAGLVGGREGPTIHMGAAIAAFLAERLRFMRLDLHTMLAAGAAAGLAAAFNAPLAAILFVVEETRKQFHYTFRSYVAVIVASAASAFAMELVGGTAPQLRLDTHAMPLPLLPVFVLLGAGLGLLGVVFNRTLVLALDWRAETFNRWPWLYPVIVGAAVGALTIVLPLAVRGGETLIPHMVVSSVPFLSLVLIALVRFVGTMASYPVGVPAGIFSPLLALATVVGLVAAVVVEATLTAMSLPVPPLMAAAFAVAAMGGLFSATVRAPLVGVVLVVELTGGYELILPTLITCVTAHVVAEELKGRPIYEVLLERALRLAGQEPRPPSTTASSPVGIDDHRR
ncbi:MAG: H(+)/Cl(-) exchange transporter ClcA [Reyranellaceae bacterium]